MVYHRKFALLDQFPHMPVEVAKDRLLRRSHVTAEGCRLWMGCRKGGCGMLRVPRPDGSANVLFAHKLAWYVAYGVYPKRPTVLAATCGNLNCIEVSHRRTDHLHKMTDEQVMEARTLFWRPWLQFNERQRMMSPPSAEQIAAWDLGMDVKTVRKVVAGKSYEPAKWQGYAKTADEVLSAVGRRQGDAAKRRDDYSQIWTQEALATRYGLALATMHYVLHGITYQSVPMPIEADKAAQRAAQLQAGRRDDSGPEVDDVRSSRHTAARQQLAAEAALVMLPA